MPTRRGGAGRQPAPTAAAAAAEAGTRRRAPQPRPSAAAARHRQPRRSRQRTTASGERIFASPLARRMAPSKRASISSRSRAAGPHGRIVKADVERGASRAAAPAAAAAPQRRRRSACSAAPRPQPVVRRAGDRRACRTRSMRKMIARRLTESKQTVPHFYLTMDCEIDALLAARAGDQRASAEKKGATSSRSTTS